MVEVVKSAMESVFTDLLVPLTVTMYVVYYLEACSNDPARSSGKRWGDLKSIDLTEVKPIELAAVQKPAIAQPPKQELVAPKVEPVAVKVQEPIRNEVAKPAVKEQKPVVNQSNQSEPSSSLGDVELESILSEFSVPEGEDLPDDAELMSIFDMCKNNGM